MQEHEWLMSVRPDEMTDWVMKGEIITPRQARLFCCAAARTLGAKDPAGGRLDWIDEWEGDENAESHGTLFRMGSCVESWAKDSPPRSVLCDVLRDIMGNPFCPVVTEAAYCNDPRAKRMVDAHASARCSRLIMEGLGKAEAREKFLAFRDSLVIPQRCVTSEVVELARAVRSHRPDRECWSCQGNGTRMGAGPDRGNPTCDECSGRGRIDWLLDGDALAALGDALEEAGCVDLSTSQRRREQVMEERVRHAVMGGCCEKFADHKPCDCLDDAPGEGVIAHLRGEQWCRKCRGTGVGGDHYWDAEREMTVHCNQCWNTGRVRRPRRHWTGCWAVEALLYSPENPVRAPAGKAESRRKSRTG